MIADEIFQGQLIFYFIVGVGVIVLAGAVFGLIYSQYESTEKKVMDGISDYASHLYKTLDLMFMRKTMNYCYMLILIFSIVFGFLGFVLGLQHSLFGAVVGALALGFLGFKMPGIVVDSMFKRRLAKFELQLVDALNMMSNAIKSGLSFMQVVQLLEKELPNPASQEFAMVLKENRIGITLNEALMNMTDRVPSDDLFMIINSVVSLSQQGGDLSEAFETIAFTIRERQRVQEKIKTLAQAGMTQAAILAGLPFALMGMMYMMQPDSIVILFATNLGRAMLAAMVVMIGLGALWMKKILTIEI
jgi:tight adherence protein B